MNKILVLYKSKYGATQKYAAWLEEALPCDVFPAEQYKKIHWESYDSIIFASGIYAGGLAGFKILRVIAKNCTGKKCAVFCVGASPLDEKALAEIKTRNLKETLADFPVFYGRGAWDTSKMTCLDRILCGALQKAVAKTAPGSREPWMEALLCAGGKSCDWTDKAYLLPLIQYIKEES